MTCHDMCHDHSSVWAGRITPSQRQFPSQNSELGAMHCDGTIQSAQETRAGTGEQLESAAYRAFLRDGPSKLVRMVDDFLKWLGKSAPAVLAKGMRGRLQLWDLGDGRQELVGEALKQARA